MGVVAIRYCFLGGTMKTAVFWSLFFLSGVYTGSTFAFSLGGEKTINLVDQNGESHQVATIVFDSAGKDITYSIDWHEEAFADHFLSMRPFKCFEGPDKYWCRVPYPYEIRRSVSKQDFTDLEYDLLFVWKGSNEYGVNLWNGIYYKLAEQDNQLVGTLHEMDMDKLGVPPEAGDLRPVGETDLEAGDPDSHWLPRLVIE